MSIPTSCPLPANLNPLSSNGFNFSIQKLPEIAFFCQEINLPSIQLSEVSIQTPLSALQLGGDILTYSDLNIQFIIDENMNNYKSIYNWMTGLGFPETYQQYTDLMNTVTTPTTSEVNKSVSDATLHVLGSNNLSTQTIKFIDLFPISLESLTFQSTSTDVQYLVGNVTFKINRYIFE